MMMPVDNDNGGKLDDPAAKTHNNDSNTNTENDNEPTEAAAVEDETLKETKDNKTTVENTTKEQNTQQQQQQEKNQEQQCDNNDASSSSSSSSSSSWESGSASAPSDDDSHTDQADATGSNDSKKNKRKNQEDNAATATKATPMQPKRKRSQNETENASDMLEKQAASTPFLVVDWVSPTTVHVTFPVSSLMNSTQQQGPRQRQQEPLLLISGTGYLSCFESRQNQKPLSLSSQHKQQHSLQVHGYTLPILRKEEEETDKNSEHHNLHTNQRNKRTRKRTRTRIPFHAPRGSPCITIYRPNTDTTENDNQHDDEAHQSLSSLTLQIESMTDDSDNKDDATFQHPTLQASFTIEQYKHTTSPTSATDSKSSSSSCQPTVLPKEWQMAADEILRDFHHEQQHEGDRKEQGKHDKNLQTNNTKDSHSAGSSNDCFVVAICGAKGVGKSTFLRYMLHRFWSLLLRQDNDNDDNDDDPKVSLSSQTQIAVLDADLGQPEFGPPGCVTLNQYSADALRKEPPLLTPPHLHMVGAWRREEEMEMENNNNSNSNNDNDGNKASAQHHIQQDAHFLGSVSPAHADTGAYLQSIHSLIQKFRQEQQDTTLINNNSPSKEGEIAKTNQQTSQTHKKSRPRILLVNQDGWVKGVGGELLQALLQETLQTCNHVVQIEGPNASQQFDLGYLRQNKDGKNNGADNSNGIVAKTTRLHSVESFHCLNDDPGGSDERIATSPAETKEEEDTREPKRQRRTDIVPLSGPASAVLRTMRFGTYFLSPALPSFLEQSRLFENGLNDRSALEIARRLASFPPYIVPLHSVTLLDPHINDGRTTVDLSTWNASFVGLATCQSSNAENSPIPWHLLPCSGLGLIRSIDVVKGLLYILTPIRNPRHVNVLIKSNQMSIPLEMMNRGVESVSFPYMEFEAPKPYARNGFSKASGNAHDQRKGMAEDSSEENEAGTMPLVLGSTPIKSRNSIARRRHHHHRHRHRHHSHKA